jgi:hypothetical protein
LVHVAQFQTYGCADAPDPQRQCLVMKNAYEDLYYLRSTIGR